MIFIEFKENISILSEIHHELNKANFIKIPQVHKVSMLERTLKVHVVHF